MLIEIKICVFYYTSKSFKKNQIIFFYLVFYYYICVKFKVFLKKVMVNQLKANLAVVKNLSEYWNITINSDQVLMIDKNSSIFIDDITAYDNNMLCITAPPRFINGIDIKYLYNIDKDDLVKLIENAIILEEIVIPDKNIF